MFYTSVQIPLEAVRAYCRTQPIQRLSVFGSALREDFTPESDIDLLIEFRQGARVTFLDLYDIQQALEALIGREVDLVTPKALSPYFRDDVTALAETIYEAR